MKQQKGMVLLVSLILLVVMSLIVIPTLEQGVVDQIITNVSSDHQRADAAAEAALSGGETALNELVDAPEADANANDIVDPVRRDNAGEIEQLPADWSWWLNPSTGNQNTNPFGIAATPGDASSITYGGLPTPPRYVVEYIGYDLQDSTGRVEVVDPAQRMRRIGPSYYRVTGAGVGGQDNTLSRFQSVYIKRQ